MRLFTQPLSSEVRSCNSRHENQRERDNTRKTEMTTFGHQQALPPTPDTISTDTLRRFKRSNDTLGRGTTEGEHEPEMERLHRISDTPSYNSASNIRPHSAGETVTSRREGHGWDTVTQSEFTETNSDLDVELPSSLIYDCNGTKRSAQSSATRYVHIWKARWRKMGTRHNVQRNFPG